MKRVIVLVGSALQRNTWRASKLFLEKLEALGRVSGELVVLSDHRVETCRGCMHCFEEGEEFCPLKDDRDLLLEKMAASDGVVFASPVYSFQVSGWMKIFLDRLAFLCHRPRFFGKTATSIATQGFYGGRAVTRYLNFLATSIGFHTVRGAYASVLLPISAKSEAKLDRAMTRLARRFHASLMKPGLPSPSWVSLLGFRAGRQAMVVGGNEKSRDYQHYRDHGWLTSDYFYPTRLGPLKKTAGWLVDRVVGRMMASERATVA